MPPSFSPFGKFVDELAEGWGGVLLWKWMNSDLILCSTTFLFLPPPSLFNVDSMREILSSSLPWAWKNFLEACILVCLHSCLSLILFLAKISVLVAYLSLFLISWGDKKNHTHTHTHASLASIHKKFCGDFPNMLFKVFWNKMLWN